MLCTETAATGELKSEGREQKPSAARLSHAFYGTLLPLEKLSSRDSREQWVAPFTADTLKHGWEIVQSDATSQQQPAVKPNFLPSNLQNL